MTGEVTFDEAVVRKRWEQLESVREAIDSLLQPTEIHVEAETPVVWTEAPKADSFRGTYCELLEVSLDGLFDAREQTHRLAVELQASMQALDDVDEQIARDVDALVERLEKVPDRTNTFIGGGPHAPIPV